MTPLAAKEAERLEPCPFCQGAARIEDHRLSWSVHCNSCTACVLGERAPEPDGEMPDSYYAVFRQAAVTAWNRRASQQSAAQATAEPVAWALLNECDPEVTADPELADYWKRKGRSNFTSLYAGPSSATLEKIAFLEGHCEQMQKEFASIVGYNNKLLTELADYRGKQIIKPVTAPDRAPSTDSAADARDADGKPRIAAWRKDAARFVFEHSYPEIMHKIELEAINDDDSRGNIEWWRKKIDAAIAASMPQKG